MSDTWRAYFPDDAETPEDAVVLRPQVWREIYNAEDAAEIACKYDYGNRDGWERNGETFLIHIIAPDGSETCWSARHEPTIHHSVEEIA